MALALDDGSPASVLAHIERLLASPSDFGDEFDKITLGDWASVHIYLPQPDIKSAITPPFMEAFIVLQKQLYQFAALTKTGVADIGQLGDGDRNDLLLSVVVTGGSSDYVADLQKPMLGILKRMVGKMTGKQAAVVIVCLSALVATGWSFSAWLDQTKTVKLEELKSKDHIAALQAIHFATEEQSKAFQRVIDILAKQGDTGKRALEVIEQTNEALLKAAASNPKTVINEVEITRTEAELLRTPTRKKAQQKIVQQEVKVVDINTTDPFDLQIILSEPSSGVQHRIKFKDDLFAGEGRHRLFDALEKRSLLWVELAIKEIDGEVRSVQLLRTIDRPAKLEPDDEVASGDN
jgi:hypothetical protein